MSSSRNLFLLFLGISFLTFWPSIGSGFVFDFIGWQDDYDHGQFWDFLNCFGYNGNHQLLHLIFYSFYKVFGIQGFPWFILFCSLHALNGLLLYMVARKWMTLWGSPFSHVMTLLCTIIFLVHPYNVEPVVWKVCIHYLLSFAGMFGVLFLFGKYIEQPSRKIFWWMIAIYFLSLFLLEISFITPALITMAGLISLVKTENKKLFFQKNINVVGALWGLLVGYLVLNKFTLGKLVGHYGADVHLKFNLLTTMSSELKYVVKHFFFARYFSNKLKNQLFDVWLSNPLVIYGFLIVFLIVSILYLFRIRKIKPVFHLAYFGFVASLLLIVPVVNLFFDHLQLGMNDRYSYLPLGFLLAGLASLLSSARKTWVYFIPVALAAISLILQQKTLSYWKGSTQVLQSLKKDFRWHDAPYVFILNSPNDYNGIVMTCMIKGDTGIDELLDYQTPRPYNGKMYDIFQFNMTSPNDGVRVEQTGPMELKVTFNQWGNWWHLHGIGGSAYENEYYKVEPLDYPYKLTFKQFPPGSVIIYQDSMTWKEFVLKEIGG